MYMVGRVLVNVDASFIKNQFYNAGEVGSGTEQISLKAIPPSYWDPAWNMQVFRRGDSEVVPLLVPDKRGHQRWRHPRVRRRAFHGHGD